MTPNVRFVLIGAGAIAQSYRQAFENHPVARLAAVVDVRLEAAAAMAESLGCKAYRDLDALFADDAGIDAAVICTPPDTHEALALSLAERGIHIICEKPFALTSESAERMIAAANAHRVVITMASKFRYVEDIIRARSIVSSGILGDTILFENAFTSRVDMSNRWNARPEISGGGVLIDNGTHSVDIMRYFLGELAAVQVLEGRRVQALEVEDTVRVFTRSRSGVMGSIDLSWSINKELDYYLNIYGSRGTILVGWKESRYRQDSSREWVVFGRGYNKVQAFSGILANFSRHILNKEPLLINHEDALASVHMIESAYRSMNDNRWVHVPSPSEAELML